MTKAWAPFIGAVLSVDVLAGAEVLTGVGVLAGVGVLTGAGTPTLGVLGLEVPPPQAVTSVAAIAIAAVRKSADVIIVFLSKGGKDNANEHA